MAQTIYIFFQYQVFGKTTFLLQSCQTFLKNLFHSLGVLFSALTVFGSGGSLKKPSGKCQSKRIIQNMFLISSIFLEFFFQRWVVKHLLKKDGGELCQAQATNEGGGKFSPPPDIFVCCFLMQVYVSLKLFTFHEYQI